METISNLKKATYRKLDQVTSYNKQKDELKKGEELLDAGYSESYNNTQ